MQRNKFLKSIQQTSEGNDLRKLSIRSITTNTQFEVEKKFYHHQSHSHHSYHSQLPTFINRKIKNLKPYTNHFKRFNAQNTKVVEEKQKNLEDKIIKNYLNPDNTKISRSSPLKNFDVKQQIKPTQIGQKITEISVYQQFLQKTSTLFSSHVIEAMYQQALKKRSKNQKEIYQRSHRHVQKETQKNNIIPREQRRSMGGISFGDEMQFIEQKSSSGQGIKSMNQLPKNEQGVVKSDRVCIIPNMIDIKNEDLPLREGLKYLSSIKNRRTGKITQFFKKDSERKEIKIIQESKDPEKRAQTEEKKKNSQFKTIQKYQIQQKRQQNLPVENTESPSKQINRLNDQKNKQSKPRFNLNVGFNSKNQEKTPKVPLGNKIQKETTINVDKQKVKLQSSEFPLPSKVTAFSYIVYEPSFSLNDSFNLTQQNLKSSNKIFSNSRVMASINCKTVVQIASLTKIMTFLVALQICEKLKIDATKQKVRIGKFEANINGTSAEIKQGEVYMVEQLFYGLMLPSGNDASLALATWGGKKMLIHEIKQKQKLKRKSTNQNFELKTIVQIQGLECIINSDNQKICFRKKKCYDRFILEMNKKARCLGMTKTNYANSHGLSNNLNKSCAFDLCILCEYAMTNENFRKVVSTIQYRSTVLYEQAILQSPKHQKNHFKVEQYENMSGFEQLDDIEHANDHCDEESIESLSQKQDEKSSKEFYRGDNVFLNVSSDQRQEKEQPVVYGSRQIYWQNTHKLLNKQEYIGIKTGITNTAGPCLASCIKTVENRCFIIIVLNSKRLNYRFKDTETLKKWVYKRQNLMQENKKPQIQSSIGNYDTKLDQALSIDIQASIFNSCQQKQATER